jgi:phosphoribosylanthranilate isomerase
MALKTFVMVSNISGLSDARYCAGMGVSVLSFALDGMKAIPLQNLSDITEWIAGVDLCGRFIESNADDVKEVLAEATLSYIQLDDAELAAELQYTDQRRQLIYTVASADGINNMESYFSDNNDLVDSFVVECDQTDLMEEAKGETIRLSSEYSVLLGFGFDATTVNDILESTNLKGIALNGSEETQPGFKDYGEIMDILEAIEED